LPGAAEPKKNGNPCTAIAPKAQKGSNFIELYENRRKYYRKMSKLVVWSLVFVNGHNIANLNAPGATRGGISVPPDSTCAR
jgi:hypothetical protein